MKLEKEKGLDCWYYCLKEQGFLEKNGMTHEIVDRWRVDLGKKGGVSAKLTRRVGAGLVVADV